MSVEVPADGMTCVNSTADCRFLADAFSWAVSSASGLPVALHLLNGTHTIDSGMHPGEFNASSAASALWMLGDGAAVIRTMSRPFLEVFSGAPPIVLRGMIVEGHEVRSTRLQPLPSHSCCLTVLCAGVQDAPAISVYGATLTIEQCTFRSNAGSALHINGGDVRIRSSAFVSNGGLSIVQGGAIRASAGQVLIEQSSFDGNRASTGAALHASGAVILTVLQSTLASNRAAQSGGAFYVTDSARVLLGRMTLLEDNSAPELGGASVYLDGTAARVDYVLPAPLGHWVANSVHCSAAADDGDLCVSERYNTTLTRLPRVSDENFPFQCAVRSY
jgi:hypothetical protein